MLKAFLKDETGLELSEYAVAAALIAIAAAGVFSALGDVIGVKINELGGQHLFGQVNQGDSTRVSMFLVSTFLLVPLAAVIAYYDVRYRRIPNAFVLAAFSGGVLMHAILGGWQGLYSSLGGCLLGFVLMFILHVFGAMGAGDVKLCGDWGRDRRPSWSRPLS